MRIIPSFGPINLTLLFNNNLQIPGVDPFKQKSKDVYGIDTEPVISQFPDVLALILPSNQVSMVAEGKRIIVSNSGIGPIANRNVDKLISFVNGINSLVTNNDLKAYGFNYDYTLEITGVTGPILNLYKSVFINNEESLTTKLGGEILSVNQSLTFEHNGSRAQFTFNPLLDESLNLTNKLNLFANVHHLGNLPTGGVLETDFIEESSNMLTIFKSLLHV